MESLNLSFSEPNIPRFSSLAMIVDPSEPGGMRPYASETVRDFEAYPPSPGVCQAASPRCLVLLPAGRTAHQAVPDPGLFACRMLPLHEGRIRRQGSAAESRDP